MPRLDQYLEGVKLPTMPEVAQSLVKTLNEDDVPFEKVRNAISKDPGLTAKLIRLANSARFGLPRAVSSLDDAISMVGLNQVRTLSLAACMSDAFPVIPGMSRSEYWTESMACAGFSQWLARAVGTDVQQSWLTGFMARLGELIIGQKEPERLQEIERQPHHPGGRWERESQMLGFTEGEISAELARRWNFPPDIVLALAASSNPLEAKPFSRLGAIVHVATLLAEIGIEEHKNAEDTINALPLEVLQALQLNHDWLRDNLPDVALFTDTSGL
jgi:HD-like signal output (HDOD) protein